MPENFKDMSEEDQLEQVMLLQKRQLHYSYVTATKDKNPLHYGTLTHDLTALRINIFRHASDPWEGDNVTLKADLTRVVQNWPTLAMSGLESAVATTPCPITFSEEERKECLRLNPEQIDADKQLQLCADIVSVANLGWVSTEFYDEVKERERKFKEDVLTAAESDEERRTLCEHWIIDASDEDEYT